MRSAARGEIYLRRRQTEQAARTVKSPALPLIALGPRVGTGSLPECACCIICPLRKSAIWQLPGRDKNLTFGNFQAIILPGIKAVRGHHASYRC